MGEGEDQAESRHEEKRDNGPEGNEVGREGDEDVGLICHDVATIKSDSKAADASEAKVDKDDVGKFVAQHVKIEENWLEKPREKPAQIEEKSNGEVEESVTTPELKPE